MRTITGLFDSHDEAKRAVELLKDAGIPGDDISIVANNADGSHGDDAAEGAGAGAGIGAVVGGAGGFLAGLGMLAVPGIGPVAAGGWLLATTVGAAAGGVAGGLMGALSDAGVDERDAHVYAEGVRRGGILVTALVADSRADDASAILYNTGVVDIKARRRDFESEGWTGFDENAEPYSPDQVRSYRASLVSPGGQGDRGPHG